MKEKIEEIIKKYESTKEYYHYCPWIEINNDYFDMYEELKEIFKTSNIKHQIKKIELDREVSYDSDMIIISWIENNDVQLFTVLVISL